MMVSTKGRYALRVMLDLAQQEPAAFVSLRAIALRQDISMKYLESIVAVLNRAGFLESQRGKEGGYRLAKPPAQYTVSSILDLTEGGLAPVACLERDRAGECCRAGDCLTLPLWQKLDSVINTYLASVTLQDVLTKNL